MTDAVIVETNAEGVMLVTLNRPETLNSLDTAMGEQLIAAVTLASADDAVRALVITGAGRGFCSGANAGGFIAEGAPPPPRSQRMDRRGGSARLVEAMAACDVPIIAAINGPAAGAGCGIALCCDIRFMAASARMGSIFIKRGLASDYGLAFWLPRIVGAAKAYELAYDGNLLDAPRALEAGLVHRVLPDDELLAQAMAYAATIAKGPPLGYTTLRRMLVRSVTSDSVAAFAEYEWSEQARLLGTNDVVEGFRAFL
ncbi:MAG: enoyl-CoA hydratase/isomerase family protein, partial [Dehalococcoidia bacterium]